MSYVFCIREKAARDGDAMFYKIDSGSRCPSRTTFLQIGNARVPRLVFCLGPFKSTRVAQEVAQQAHGVMYLDGVRGEQIQTNPLTVRKFRNWVRMRGLKLTANG